jgi:ABC-type molybdate transport system substrate-binding protein
VFRKAGLIKPGAQAALEEKALQLVGSANSAKPPAGRTAYGWHVAEGRADIFLTYCTNAVAARKENQAQQIVALPATVAVAADYGLTVINDAPPAAQRFADFLMSTQGQMILTEHGFASGK